jgi:hypothetical protein
MTHRWFALLLCCLLPWLAPGWAGAHAVGSSYLELTLRGAHVEGRLRVARADLEAAVGIERGLERAEDMTEARALIEGYLLSRLELSNARGACPLLATALRPEAAHVLLELSSECRGALSVRYDLLFEHDRTHEAYLSVRGTAELDGVFTHTQRSVRLAQPGPLAVLASYLGVGVHHILGGADHLLFLLTLLLAAVVRWDGRRALPAPSARAAALGIARIVTAFTAAHSLTLSLTALGVVTLH